MSAATSATRPPLYRLWPRYRPHAVELGAAGNKLLMMTGGLLALVGAVLSLPQVVRATGLSPLQVFGILGPYFFCMVLNDHVLHPLAVRSPAGFAAQLVITPAYNVLFLALFVVLPGDPRSPLWLGLLLYTCVTAGWQEIDASLWLLALHTLGPLLTIPFFLAAGADPAWSVAGPAVCSVMCLVAYHLGATTSAAWRATRAEQAAAIEQLRMRNAELERERIVQDLHDSVGSSLSIFGLSADLVEQNAHAPDTLLRIAGTLRAASREGLSELRGVLDTLAPQAATSAALLQALTQAAERIGASSGRRVYVVGDHAETQVRTLSGAQRHAVTRVFQEAVSNALRHADAANVEIELHVDAAQLTLHVTNDGAAWTATSTDARTDGGGRGLPGMQARAHELGGVLEISSLTDARTRVTLILPLAR